MTRRTGTTLACLLTLFATAAQRLVAAPCVEATLEAVLEPALDADGRALPGVADAVEIDCDLTLLPGQVVTKRLVLKGPAASGVTVDCNDATLRGEHWLTHFEHPRHTIDVRSVEDPAAVWRGAENVTVKGCKVHGSVRVHGIATSLERLRRMSYSPDHTRTLRFWRCQGLVGRRRPWLAPARAGLVGSSQAVPHSWHGDSPCRSPTPPLCPPFQRRSGSASRLPVSCRRGSRGPISLRHGNRSCCSGGSFTLSP